MVEPLAGYGRIHGAGLRISPQGRLRHWGYPMAQPLAPLMFEQPHPIIHRVLGCDLTNDNYSPSSFLIVRSTSPRMFIAALMSNGESEITWKKPFPFTS